MPIVHLKNSAGVITEHTGTAPFTITGLAAGAYTFTEGLTAQSVTVTGSTPTPSPTPTPTSTIAVTSGSGYAGSTYTVTDGGTGNWQDDQSTAEDGTGWTDIAGATSSTYVRTLVGEGRPLRWRKSDGTFSNVIHMWMPNDLGATFITASGASWFDAKRTDLMTIESGAIASMPDRFGGRTYAQTDPALRPLSSVVDGYGAAVWPNTDNSLTLVPSTESAFAYVLIVARFRAGSETSFGTFTNLVGPAGLAGNTGTSGLATSSVWAGTASKNGAALSGTILPLPKSTIEATGTPATKFWAPGAPHAANRSWQGAIFEEVRLAAAPTGDNLDRLRACVAHRNGTISAFAANQTSNPYLVNGPRVA